jgi:hypothetical protein
MTAPRLQRFCRTFNTLLVGLRGLPGGPEGIRTSDLRSAGSRSLTKRDAPKHYCSVSGGPHGAHCTLAAEQPIRGFGTSSRLPTEELAELHAIIQVIAYERDKTMLRLFES